MSSIYILWDDSHIWGLLIHRALKAWNIDHKLVRGHQIAQGLLSSKPPMALIVPGGWAKGKASSLGSIGILAVQQYVSEGGTYLGFCGGAGLALSGTGGLSLTDWERKGFENRLHHFLSGHINLNLNQDHPLVPDSLGKEALVPVWWPGQFSPHGAGATTALGKYGEPGPDFWVADLCVGSLPEGTLSDWENLYGISLMPNFLQDRPAIISGEFGKGKFILSYPHLETPASPQANMWLSHILDQVQNEPHTQRPSVPAWELSDTPVLWDDPVLHSARKSLETIIATGQGHFLLFWRNPWLLGWRRGIPGASINSLYALVCEVTSLEPNDEALQMWVSCKTDFLRYMEIFEKGVTGYLLAERLAMTMRRVEPHSVFPRGLKEQRNALFGPPPGAGGMYAKLLSTLEELTWIINKKRQ
ncbi:BPL-N domain-containing protein [Desulfovibrio gilichinskyi]|uniref:Biotin-protein ligase, N terminal n=1 Tax=Desulfovibrio gilichinskyi TaxID=1519643 RepID=A0A1X7E5C1_9BACT|nr:BPL-N domain-containing protein [Desulfovibrio gilichinskyi]SMF27623.1 Biotin-protein ligase, N terminal [Desulfovibrio gilichinskyi]